MWKFLISTIIAFAAYGGAAQSIKLTYEQQQEQKRQEIREKINLDYSVPDYNVKKPDAQVMGWRLAKMLEFLEKNYKQAIYNRQLSQISNVQIEELKVRYLPIEKMKILSVQKRDSIITVKISTLSKSSSGKLNFDVTFTFVNSISNDDEINGLFVDIARYIRKDD